MNKCGFVGEKSPISLGPFLTGKMQCCSLGSKKGALPLLAGFASIGYCPFRGCLKVCATKMLPRACGSYSHVVWGIETSASCTFQRSGLWATRLGTVFSALQDPNRSDTTNDSALAQPYSCKNSKVGPVDCSVKFRRTTLLRLSMLWVIWILQCN